MPYSVYLLYRRDAFIHALNQSETGQEYLDKAWLLEQTDQDRDTMRKQFGLRKEG